MNRIRHLTILASLVLSASLLPAWAETEFNGNHRIKAVVSGEPGDLKVDHDLFVGRTPSAEAIVVFYDETGTEYTLTYQATRDNVGFLWTENGGGTLQSKMELAPDNSLKLYDASGTTAIVLDPTTPEILVDGDPVLTQSAGDSAYLPAAIPLRSGTGVDSIAGGMSTAVALGDYSIALGRYANTTSTGYAAIALGDSTAKGDRSIACGDGSVTEVGSFGGIAMGRYCKTYDGHAPVALGWESEAKHAAVAIGRGCKAEPISVAIGELNQATATYATAMGRNSIAQSYNSFVIGAFNAPAGSTTTWVSTDPLFVIGNGTSDTQRSNALTVLKNGNTQVAGRLDAGGPVRVWDHGDLSMGEFTAGPQPATPKVP